jgi:chaperonin cofactor prefoldin
VKALLETIELVTAVASMVSAIGVIVVRTKVRQVHIMVNSRQERMEARIEQLSDSLRSAGIIVPETPEKK